MAAGRQDIGCTRGLRGPCGTRWPAPLLLLQIRVRRVNAVPTLPARASNSHASHSYGLLPLSTSRHVCHCGCILAIIMAPCMRHHCGGGRQAGYWMHEGSSGSMWHTLGSTLASIADSCSRGQCGSNVTSASFQLRTSSTIMMPKRVNRSPKSCTSPVESISCKV